MRSFCGRCLPSTWEKPPSGTFTGGGERELPAACVRACREYLHLPIYDFSPATDSSQGEEGPGYEVCD